MADDFGTGPGAPARRARRPARSWLLVPAGDRDRLARALDAEADALILDLRAAPTQPDPARSRALAAEFLGRAGLQDGRPLLFVCVNDLAGGATDADLDGVIGAGPDGVVRPDGIVLPGAIGGRSVEHLAAKLAVREAEHGLSEGGIGILPVVADTARGVLAIGTVPGCSRRLAGMAWDRGGLAVSLGLPSDRREGSGLADPCRLARSATLLAAAAAGIPALDTPSGPVRDMDAFGQECRAARRDGFGGKVAIAVSQVAVIAAVFRDCAGGA